MIGSIKFRVKDDIKFLMLDPEFRKRVIAAYTNQVENQHGWGFTVRYKGYRIRFDIDNKASKRFLTVYKGFAEEKPATQQTKLLEAA